MINIYYYHYTKYNFYINFYIKKHSIQKNHKISKIRYDI